MRCEIFLGVGAPRRRLSADGDGFIHLSQENVVRSRLKNTKQGENVDPPTHTSVSQSHQDKFSSDT